MFVILEVGDVGTFKSLTWINSSGGTSADHRGTLSFKAKVTKAWEDDETGWRYHALLEADLDVVDDFEKKTTHLKAGTKVYVGQLDSVKA